MRHLIDIYDLSVEEIDRLIDKANDIIEHPAVYSEKCKGIDFGKVILGHAFVNESKIENKS